MFDYHLIPTTFQIFFSFSLLNNSLIWILLLFKSSGDGGVQTSEAFEAVFINSGDNPFELIKDSIKYIYVYTLLFKNS